MILYFIPAEHRYVHRQTDVPKGFDFKKVDVPTSQADLMAFLNDLWAAHQIDLSLAAQAASDLTRADILDAQQEALEEIHGHAAVLANMDAIGDDENQLTVPELQHTGSVLLDLSEAIMATEPPKFGIVLSSTLERLGELRKDGWDGLRPFLKNNPAAERGIGALFAAREF